MSAYCTVADVELTLMRYTINATSEPSGTAVSDFITQVSARIDGVCAAEGFSTPVTGATSLAILRSCAIAGACYYTTRVMFPSSQGELVAEFRSEYESLLAQITAGTLALPDAAKDANDQVMSQVSVNLPSSMSPFITRDTQW